MAVTMIKNDAFEKAKKKLSQLDYITNAREHIESGNTDFPEYVESAVQTAISMAAVYHYPELSGEIQTSRYGYRSSGYTTTNDEGPRKLLQDIANGDTAKLGSILAYYQEELSIRMRLITDLEPTFEQALTEANIASKIKDPQKIKLLRLAVLHDSTFPKHKIAALGPTAFRQDQDPKKQAENDQQILQLWSDTIDRLLSNTEFGDLSADGKFDDWLFNLYIKGAADYEDISGEAVNALGIWKVLSRRGKLKPIDQDFNKFKSNQDSTKNSQ